MKSGWWRPHAALQRRNARAKGLALFIVMILMLLMALIAAASLYLAQSHFELLQEQVRRQQAFYAAEAGMQDALVRLRTGQAVAPVNIVLDGRTYTANITATQLGVNPAGPYWSVTSSVTYAQ